MRAVHYLPARGGGAPSKQPRCLSSQAALTKLCSKQVCLVQVFKVLIFHVGFCVRGDGSGRGSWRHPTVPL